VPQSTGINRPHSVLMLHVRYMLSPVCLSSVCLSVRLVHPTQPVEIFDDFCLCHLVPWSSIDMRGKLYGDRPRRTPPSGAVKRKRGSQIAVLDLSKAISRKRCKIEGNVNINH